MKNRSWINRLRGMFSSKFASGQSDFLAKPSPQSDAPGNISSVIQQPNPAGSGQGSVQCISPAGLHRMAYLTWGDPQNPNVLLCVHGLTRRGSDFAQLARAI